MLLSIAQASGRKLWLDALYVGETYAGLLEGTMRRQDNLLIVEHIGERIPSAWGERVIHIIRPEQVSDPGIGSEEWLPPVVFFAWLHSDPIAKDWEASELVVIWFGALDTEASIARQLEAALCDVPWESVARDYDV